MVVGKLGGGVGDGFEVFFKMIKELKKSFSATSGTDFFSFSESLRAYTNCAS
jgi:hypothetical protein